MKHILKKKLTVGQIILIIVLPLALSFIAYDYFFSNKPFHFPKRHFVKKHIAPQKKEPVIDTTPLGRLKSYVDSINGAQQLFGGSWSFYLTDVDSGKPICSININHGLSPASVMKVVTTGTALSLLGPGFKFTTALQYDGNIDTRTKTLNGNIYIKGGGDPSLGSETFGSSIKDVMADWVKSIQEAGIDSIAGSIIADAESFENDPVPTHWTWEDMQNNYGAGPCGLNIHENVFDMYITVTGKETKIKTDPVIPGLKLYNQVVHNPDVARSYVYVQGAPFQFERTAMGEVSSAFQEQGVMPDPALFCAQTLKSSLIENDIGVRDSATTFRLMSLNKQKLAKKESRKFISSSSSPTLADLVSHTNHVSQNFYAESILRGISWKLNGYGSSSSSVDIIYDYWKSHGLDLRGICMVDGCGLSRMNTITTHQLVEMLRTFAKDSSVFPTFYKSLPIAGESGTIRKLAEGTEADGNLHAKSGTMARIKSYAGYVTTRSGKMLCFAMVGNNTLWTEEELKGKFEQLFILMAKLP